MVGNEPEVPISVPNAEQQVAQPITVRGQATIEFLIPQGNPNSDPTSSDSYWATLYQGTSPEAVNAHAGWRHSEWVMFGLWDATHPVTHNPQNALNLTTDPNNNFINLDARRFYIRVVDGSVPRSTDFIDVQWVTHFHSSEEHPHIMDNNNGAPEITLKRVGSTTVFMSQALLLVSSSIDTHIEVHTGSLPSARASGVVRRGHRDFRVRHASMFGYMAVLYGRAVYETRMRRASLFGPNRKRLAVQLYAVGDPGSNGQTVSPFLPTTLVDRLWSRHSGGLAEFTVMREVLERIGVWAWTSRPRIPEGRGNIEAFTPTSGTLHGQEWIGLVRWPAGFEAIPSNIPLNDSLLLATMRAYQATRHVARAFYFTGEINGLSMAVEQLPTGIATPNQFVQYFRLPERRAEMIRQYGIPNMSLTDVEYYENSCILLISASSRYNLVHEITHLLLNYEERQFAANHYSGPASELNLMKPEFPPREQESFRNGCRLFPSQVAQIWRNSMLLHPL